MIWQHHHRPSVPSTNQWAMEWLRHTMPQGPVLFTTDHQTEGRGQRDRRWSSEAGRDLCMSLAVPVQPHWNPTLVNMHVALAVQDLLSQHLPDHQSPGAIRVKWPNDVLVWHAGTHHKAAGILVENVWRGSQWSTAVIGVGLNVGSSRLSRSYPAVSLAEAWHVELSPSDLAQDLAKRLIQRLNGGVEGLMEDYHDALFGLGEPRTFVVHERTWHGMFRGVNAEGQGRFEWSSHREAETLPPSEWLSSSEVQWCW